MEFEKHFSVDEAQGILVEIRPKLEEIARLKAILDRKGYDVHKHRYFGGMGPNGQKVFPNEMEDLVEKVAEINTLGIQLKDMNTGLIDFPHVRKSGEEVFLCYKLPEEEIVAWHTIEGGLAGRRALKDL
jgi:hypothetical protein